jgi:hypothetical protein
VSGHLCRQDRQLPDGSGKAKPAVSRPGAQGTNFYT